MIRPVDIVRGELYEVRHDRECQVIHAEHRLRSEIKDPIRLFRVRVEDFCDRRVPQARVLEPPIPRMSVATTSGMMASVVSLLGNTLGNQKFRRSSSLWTTHYFGYSSKTVYSQSKHGSELRCRIAPSFSLRPLSLRRNATAVRARIMRTVIDP
jgi:hypothetical protein